MALKIFPKIQSYSLLLARNYCSKKDDSSSFWNYFKSGKKEETKPSIERCRKRRVVREDPDLSRFGGQAYRTCGSAYVVQKDVIPHCETQMSEEDQILARIESDLSNKDSICDPMPKFESVEQRLIDLTERKLHPYYKRYMALPKRNFAGGNSPETPFSPYKCQCGPVKPDEIPDILKFNKQLLEKKNIFADFKRVELPKQMVIRIVEMDKNRRPTLERKENSNDKK